MRVAIDDNKNKKEIKNKNYDLIIFLEDEIDYLNSEKVDKNKILKFLDYLYEKIERVQNRVQNNIEIHYFGENLRVWSYLLLFSYTRETKRLFQKNREVKESNLLRLDLDNIGLDIENIKNKISKKEYSNLPELIKNFYYENLEECELSEIGKDYVKNIKNKRKWI